MKKIYVLEFSANKPVPMDDKPTAFRLKKDATEYLKNLGLKYSESNDVWYKESHNFCGLNVLINTITIEPHGFIE